VTLSVAAGLGPDLLGRVVGVEGEPKWVDDTHTLEEGEEEHGEEPYGLGEDPCRDEGACEGEEEGEAHHKAAAAAGVAVAVVEEQPVVEELGWDRGIGVEVVERAAGAVAAAAAAVGRRRSCRRSLS
jgi:hypothetical protein